MAAHAVIDAVTAARARLSIAEVLKRQTGLGRPSLRSSSSTSCGCDSGRGRETSCCRCYPLLTVRSAAPTLRGSRAVDRHPRKSRDHGQPALTRPRLDADRRDECRADSIRDPSLFVRDASRRQRASAHFVCERVVREPSTTAGQRVSDAAELRQRGSARFGHTSDMVVAHPMARQMSDTYTSRQACVMRTPLHFVQHPQR